MRFPSRAMSDTPRPAEPVTKPADGVIVVTGGSGFIGSNLVHAFSAESPTPDLLVVDHLKNGRKYRNLLGSAVADYLDRDDFLAMVERDDAALAGVRAVIHQGACSTTTEWDGQYMLRNNFEYSKKLLHWCLRRSVPLIYASSASVYGNGREFREDPANEAPLNVYGYSKKLFDDYVRRLLPRARSQVVGLRYFNVYGPREGHKGSMASVAFHFDRQVRELSAVRLFEGSDGYGPGEQRRDFVHVADVVAVNRWLLAHPEVSGIFNVGTGRAQTFNEVAYAVIGYHDRGRIEYIPFPSSLVGSYQSFTEADLTSLRAAGYTAPFRPVEHGVPEYLAWLARK